jgi:hypothetical protein
MECYYMVTILLFDAAIWQLKCKEIPLCNEGTASQGRSTSRSPLSYLHAATLLTRSSCKWKETASQSTRSHLMSTSSDLPTDDHASAKEDAILMVQTHPQEITCCQEEV